jgi:hypothetical protein
MQLRAVALVPALIALTACGANVFPVEVTGESTIRGDPTPLVPDLLGAFNIGSFSNIDFNQTQEFQNQGVTKDQVESVKTDYIQLKIVSPDTQDFSFLESLQFFAQVGDQEVLVAEKMGIDQLDLRPPNPVLELDVTDAELQPFVVAPAMSIVVRGKGRLPPQETRLEARVGLDVTVKVF